MFPFTHEGFDMTAIRRPGAASATVLIALSASLVAAHLIAPEWSRRAGLDVWNLAALEHQYRDAAAERADLTAQGEQDAARRTAGNQIAAQLIDGTTTLPAAAADLLEVFRADSGRRMLLGLVYPAAPTERHLFARHGIDRVAMLLAEDPARSAAVVARLEVEYRAMCVAPESPHAP